MLSPSYSKRGDTMKTEIKKEKGRTILYGFMDFGELYQLGFITLESWLTYCEKHKIICYGTKEGVKIKLLEIQQ